MIRIEEHLMPQGHPCRPGRPMVPRSVTVHWTANTNAGADALMHAKYLASVNRPQTSWHYTVDAQRIVRHLPENEIAWHAGDGANGPGNTTSIAVEVCVDPSSAYPGGPIKEATFNNLVELLADICRRYGWPPDEQHIVPHQKWSGKLCPNPAYINLEAVRKAVAERLNSQEPQVQKVAVQDAAGNPLCSGVLLNGKTMVPLRDLAEAMGLVVEWNPDGPAAVLRWPGRG